MSAIEPFDCINVFSTSYGELVFNDRYECIDFWGRAEHKEAALQEWFAFLREKLAPPKRKRRPVCLGCGRSDC